MKENNRFKINCQKKQSKRKTAIFLPPDIPYDFDGQNMTPYGGLLPLSALINKLEFGELCERKISFTRIPISMSPKKFIIAMIMALYIGYDRLNHMQYIRKDPMIAGLLGVNNLPVQSTFHRFLKSLDADAETGLKDVNKEMLRRAWLVGHVAPKVITIDTDTTINTVYGEQEKAFIRYNPKNPGKKSYMPVMSFIAETGECLCGYNRSGEKMKGKEVADYIRRFPVIIPKYNMKLRCRCDAGFYSWEAVEAFEEIKSEFIMVAQKTPRLQEKLQFSGLRWMDQKDTDGVADFMYQPIGWNKAFRYLAVRYENIDEDESDSPSLFKGKKYRYRVFVTNMKGTVWKLVEHYDGRAGCENLIKEAMHDVGMSAVPSADFTTNSIYFQLGILAYNFNRWIQILSIDESEQYQKTRLMTQRLTMVFIAAKIVKHAGRVRLSYSNGYEHRDCFKRLLSRILCIERVNGCFIPVVLSPQFV
jgi:hypothetical protein